MKSYIHFVFNKKTKSIFLAAILLYLLTPSAVIWTLCMVLIIAIHIIVSIFILQIVKITFTLSL